MKLKKYALQQSSTMFEKGGTESHVYRFTNTVLDPMSDDLLLFQGEWISFYHHA